MSVDQVLKHCDIAAKVAAKLACWLSHMPDLQEPGPQTTVEQEAMREFMTSGFIAELRCFVVWQILARLLTSSDPILADAHRPGLSWTGMWQCTLPLGYAAWSRE